MFKKKFLNKSIQSLKIDFENTIFTKTCASKDKIEETKNEQVILDVRVKLECLYWFTQSELRPLLLHNKGF